MLQEVRDIIILLEQSLKEDGENTITSWNIIADGYSSSIDAYRKTIQESHDWLSSYQSQLSADTGISKIRIKFTNVLWYFIEISKTHISQVPDDFVHKQTLVNAVRYTTEKLDTFQKQLFEAEHYMSEEEYKVFQNIRSTVLDSYQALKSISSQASYIDMIQSFAYGAYSNNYNRPEFISQSGISIEWGRHPVIEQIERDFVKNNVSLVRDSLIHIITWPNMWGKSTFLRQNALIVLLAHLGSFVPADIAKLWVVDKIFSRVWAHDNLFLWKSTFMVEMEEVSYILNNATRDSFIIIDEIGRGTSTYDGMSLAWGILRYIHDTLGAKTLFATHYHEIIDESESLKKAKNYSVAVGENEQNLVFLRKIIPGGIKKSYGLEVAKIAWIQKWIISEAKKMISRHQIIWLPAEQMSISELWINNIYCNSELESYLESLDITTLTPLDSLNCLAKIKKLSEK